MASEHDDIWRQVDAFVDGFSKIAEYQDILDHFTEAREASRERCGNCWNWLKKSYCPQEKGPMQGGPSMDQMGCSQFVWNQHDLDRAQGIRREAEARLQRFKLTGKAPRYVPPPPKPVPKPTPLSERFGQTVQPFLEIPKDSMFAMKFQKTHENNSRELNFRASVDVCHCNATNAPCWVCEESAECMNCGSIEHIPCMEKRGDEFICGICVDREEAAS